METYLKREITDKIFDTETKNDLEKIDKEKFNKAVNKAIEVYLYIEKSIEDLPF